MRVLIGGIGYRDLRDYSLGVLVTDALAERTWPDEVAVEDVSYNPIALVQRLEADPPHRRFDRAVIIGAVDRVGRSPGTVSVYRWDNGLPGPDRIHGAITEAVTGVIALDNTLIIGRHFGALPRDVIVIEVEPEVHEFGSDLSPAVAPAFEQVCTLAPRLALDHARADRIPQAPLGGGALMGDPTRLPSSYGFARVR